MTSLFRRPLACSDGLERLLLTNRQVPSGFGGFFVTAKSRKRLLQLHATFVNRNGTRSLGKRLIDLFQVVFNQKPNRHRQQEGEGLCDPIV